MAAKILSYNQCQTKNLKNTVEGAIGVKNARGERISESTFRKGEIFSLIALTSTGTWDYRWKATHPLTGEIVSGVTDILDG